MTSVVYCRLVGQAVVLTMHITNSIIMLISMQDKELLNDPEIGTMVSMQGKYLTVWNIGFQMSYFALAFACDLLTITRNEQLVPRSVRKFRHTYFSTLIWPIAMLIFSIFWPFFITNREFLFPAFIDKIFSFKSNMMMHFWILPAALWELTFLPRPVPKSHMKNIGVFTIFYILYNIVIHYTYYQRGIWPYPIFKLIYGTIYYPILQLAVYLFALYCYNTQWRFTTIAWGDDTKIKI